MSVSVEIHQQTEAELIAALKERVADLQARLARSPRAVEMYYSAEAVGLLLGFSSRWVRERIGAGDLLRCVELSGEWRVPASAVNEFLGRHELPQVSSVPARTVGELRRRCA